MRKTLKKLIGTGLAIALCITMLPVQTAQAAPTASSWDGKNLGDGAYVDDADMTGEQLLEAYSGDWLDLIFSEILTISKDGFSFWGEETKWNYEGTVVKEDVPQNWEESKISLGEAEGEITDVQALHFTNESNDYYVYKRYSEGDGAIVGVLDIYDKTTDEYVDGYWLLIKYVGDNKYTVNECLAMAKGTVDEEPKEEVKVTPNGRELAEGETVYIVKKGDCLWSIAKTLLGKGTRYKELFTRNGDIVEKATLIFPGQEIIIPAK